MEALDEQERVRCYQEVEKILLKDVVAIPLFPTRILMAYNKKVRGVRGNDLASILVTKDWTNMWIEK
jgi:ABC-type transport system substrate-binding protein